MTAPVIAARLRAMARQATGCTVYRPAKPVALFVCDRPPQADAQLWQVFSQGRRWYYSPTWELLQAQDLLPAIPALPAPRAAWNDTAYILYTCAVRCLRDRTAETDTELITLCLYHLSFDECDALARALPRVIARRLRQKQALSPAAGALILEHLFTNNPVTSKQEGTSC